MWPQSCSSINRAPSSSSVPKKSSVTLFLSQIRHNLGHGSPHSPMHRCPNWQIFLVHGSLHRSRLQISQQSFVHFLCLHFHKHGSYNRLREKHDEIYHKKRGPTIAESSLKSRIASSYMHTKSRSVSLSLNVKYLIVTLGLAFECWQFFRVRARVLLRF